MKQKIFLGTDHAGFQLKEEIRKYLENSGIDVEDCGAYKLDAHDDYPKFIFAAAKKVAENKGSMGIVFGGSGQGEAIVANKVKHIRAAVYNSNNLDIVKLSRTHNDANVLSLGARFLDREKAIEAVRIWLDTDFGNERKHKRRILQIKSIEKRLYK